jgi:TRAP-type C4-dicarboxylate transport system permease small subunit
VKLIWLLIRSAERIAVALALLGALSLGCVAVVTLVDVVIRPFGMGVRGAVDLVQLFVITGIFLAMPYTFLSEGHVRVEVVLDLLPPRAREIVLVIVTMVALAFLSLLVIQTYAGFLDVMARRDRTLHIALPHTLFWTPMLVGLGLSILATLALLARKVLDLRERDPDPAG